MKIPILIGLLLATACDRSFAGSRSPQGLPVDGASPDGKWRVVVEPTFDPSYGPTGSGEGFRFLAYRKRRGRKSVLRLRAYSPAAWHVENFKWSPDSKFAVMTTANSGGHNPWHAWTFVYCVADNSFRYLSEKRGSVVDTAFDFTGNNTLRVAVRTGDNDESKPVEILLGKEAARMKKVETLPRKKARLLRDARPEEPKRER